MPENVLSWRERREAKSEAQKRGVGERERERLFVFCCDRI
jgi:hypothetical protein